MESQGAFVTNLLAVAWGRSGGDYAWVKTARWSLYSDTMTQRHQFLVTGKGIVLHWLLLPSLALSLKKSGFLLLLNRNCSFCLGLASSSTCINTAGGVQEPPRPNSQHKGDVCAPEGREQEARTGDRGWGRRGREQEKRDMDICPGGTKDCLWMERRQACPIGKWQFIKEKGETPC